jgi:D-arabinose 1-dehydrogenase-like Zn-dependent alcohol dehydrogenase|tara:strand:+ start:1767 stop:2327 length:561 start_codon:yes stop_codon:yes gene_type:complete
MRKILVIGAGGIGSFLIQFLNKVKLYDITVADPDKVEEKNIPYQNFGNGHIGHNKAEVMKNNYYKSVSKATPYPILTEKQMQGYDLVVCCVDNLGVRRTLYNTSLKWLDLRAQGRNAALVSHKANPEMYDMLLAGDDRSYSCQGDSWDGTNKNVHFMQVAIAGLGAQWIQRWFNEEQVREYMVVNV